MDELQSSKEEYTEFDREKANEIFENQIEEVDESDKNSNKSDNDEILMELITRMIRNLKEEDEL